MSELLNIGLVDSFRLLHPKKQQFTYWSNMFKARGRNAGWRIDYILTSKELGVSEAAIHD